MRPSTRFSPAFALFAALPVVFFLAFAFDGMDAADRGFIPALAYRILDGQVPHHDFFYVRPPLTPVLHTLEMAILPDTWEMLGYRLFFYVFLWLSVFWSVRSLQRLVDFGQMGVSPWVLGAIGFAFSVHNFFQAPWHTVDGIFFSALGFYLVTRGPRTWSVIAGMVAFALAAHTKQPFGIVPMVGLGLVWVLHGWRKALLAAVGGAAIVCGAWAVIETALTPGYSLVQEMLAQTRGVSNLNEMRWGGYQLYVRPAVLSFGVGFAAWLLLKYLLRQWKPALPMAVLAWVGFSVVAGGVVWVNASHGGFFQPKTGFNHALAFTGGAIAAVSFLTRDRKLNALLLAMSLVAWASGISWGYASPVLYSFPAVFAIAYFLGQVAQFTPPRWYWPSILVLALGSTASLNYFVYHDGLRPEITHDLGDVFPKLSHIEAGDAQYANYVELKQLHARYGDNFTVLPSMPLANYVTDTKPVLSVDWAHDGEINFQMGIDRLQAELEESRCFVFAMREELYRTTETGNYRCSTLAYVMENWQRIDSTTQFYVYAPPTPGSARFGL